MKRFTSLLISCSLVLAGAALAQQPEQQQSPSKNKQGHEKAQTAEPKQPGASQGHPEATAGSKREQRRAERQQRRTGKQAEAPSPTTQSATTETGVNPSPIGKHEGKQASKEAKHAGENVESNQVNQSKVNPAAGTGVAADATSVQQNARGKMKKPEPQQVEQIKQQHANFKAQPKPDKVPTVTFNQSYRIQGAERWQGPQYEVFRSYHPERHDQGWYRAHYTRIELIGGGYYFWNNGYWYPAWGYSPAEEYYAWDGPIYVGHRAEPPDQVIADVQAELADMGYYTGEVDGLLGPLTRQALTDYQANNGLIQTAAIDEPTLDSLGMG